MDRKLLEIDEEMAVLNAVAEWVTEWRDLGGFLSADISEDGGWSNVRIETPRLRLDDNMGRMRTRVLLKKVPDWDRLTVAIRALGVPMIELTGEPVH